MLMVFGCCVFFCCWKSSSFISSSKWILKDFSGDFFYFPMSAQYFSSNVTIWKPFQNGGRIFDMSKFWGYGSLLVLYIYFLHAIRKFWINIVHFYCFADFSSWKILSSFLSFIRFSCLRTSVAVWIASERYIFDPSSRNISFCFFVLDITKIVCIFSVWHFSHFHLNMNTILFFLFNNLTTKKYMYKRKGDAGSKGILKGGCFCVSMNSVCVCFGGCLRCCMM